MVFRFVSLLVLTLGIAQAINASEPAPLFTGFDLKSGKQVSLLDYRGKIILLDFWASWCPPCLESLPAYDQLRMDLGTEEFDVISINVDEDIQDALDFLEKRPVSFTVISDPQGEIGIPYMVRTLPRTFILDRQGRIVTAFSSFDEDDEIILKATISNLLEPPE
jgi:thiol-disulfide isomerase/thioredoxin